jgi:alginate O-acetyltransferase complex protein AlgI
VAIHYLGSLQLANWHDFKQKKRILLTGLLCVDIGILMIFKYCGHPMPLGISFYTFTVISYLLDVYVGKIEAETSFLHAGIYMMLFPKMISGPITSYPALVNEIRERKMDLSDIEDGLVIFTIGLGFKVILANHFGLLWNSLESVGFDSISTPLAWIGAIGYSAQLYFDFQGYSLMAIGIGRMLGFHLQRNFNHPYRAKSVSEYYRRWHISLGQWFKNYLYIPLGGNRKGETKTVFNLLIVWLITGLWHGVTPNFLLWGFVLWMLIALEKLFFQKILSKGQMIPHIYLLMIMPLTWMVFAINNLRELGVYFSRLFPFFGTACYVNKTDFIRYLSSYIVFFVVAFVISLPFADKLYEKHKGKILFKVILFFVFWVCVYEIANGVNNPFLYFRF